MSDADSHREALGQEHEKHGKVTLSEKFKQFFHTLKLLPLWKSAKGKTPKKMGKNGGRIGRVADCVIGTQKN